MLLFPFFKKKFYGSEKSKIKYYINLLHLLSFTNKFYPDLRFTNRKIIIYNFFYKTLFIGNVYNYFTKNIYQFFRIIFYKKINSKR